MEPERVCALMHTALERLVEALEAAPETRGAARSTCCRRRSGAQVLVEWNATEAAYPRDACVHELFEAQAARDAGRGGGGATRDER